MSNAMLEGRAAGDARRQENAMLAAIRTEPAPATNAMAQHREASRPSPPTNAMYDIRAKGNPHASAFGTGSTNER